jgi:hypothetical protein
MCEDVAVIENLEQVQVSCMEDQDGISSLRGE